MSATGALQINERTEPTAPFCRQSVHGGALILVNAKHPLRLPVPESALAELPGGVLLEKTAARLLTEALRSIGATNEIVFVSGYRSHAEQIRIWDDTTAERGTEYAHTYVALPGCSEHESGLAIDLALNADNIDFITPDFPYSGVCQAFRGAAARYGFIERYPKGKETVTGIGHEPWHFRYVGWPHSAVIGELGLTLEEYTDWLKSFPYPARPYVFETGGKTVLTGYLPASEKGVLLFRAGRAAMTLSGNNADGFVLTEWEKTDD
jgi:D-alanyl-D-alanine dipeptidase/carboxypeptidase